MLTQYGPDLLEQCESALGMSKDLVKAWLEGYMFKNDPDRRRKAESISEWLADRRNFKSHSRHIPRDEIQCHGIDMAFLEKDSVFQDLVLSVFHATSHTFGAASAVKIIENHDGRALIKQLPSIELGIAPTGPG